jgi:hypothetical protein
VEIIAIRIAPDMQQAARRSALVQRAAGRTSGDLGAAEGDSEAVEGDSETRVPRIENPQISVCALIELGIDGAVTIRIT